MTTLYQDEHTPGFYAIMAHRTEFELAAINLRIKNNKDATKTHELKQLQHKILQEKNHYHDKLVALANQYQY